MEGLRQRKGVAKVITEFDAFPKVPESYQETSTSGGTVSILTFLLITALVLSEFLYYSHVVTKYEYEVDKSAVHKIRINVDMTVAMECDDIGADVLDLSGTSIDTSEHLHMEPTYFAMSKAQSEWWEAFRVVRRDDGAYQSINDAWHMNSVFGKFFATAMPKKDLDEFQGKDFDACRIYGNVEVNKVAGNFHVTAGKSVPHPRGHAHLSSLVSELNYNFSHRIDMLSFGDPHPGIINPLDGDLEIADDAYHIYQYYVKIVPTYINGIREHRKANQYSVTQRSRAINHISGSHGVPGIFFKYDLHPICVKVTESRGNFRQFLIRLCGIIGGVFATSGMLHSFVGFLTDIVLCQLKNRTHASGNASQLSHLSAQIQSVISPSDVTPPLLVEPTVSLVAPKNSDNS